MSSCTCRRRAQTAPCGPLSRWVKCKWCARGAGEVLARCWRGAGEVRATSESSVHVLPPIPPLPIVNDPLRSIRELTFQGENLIKHELPTCCRHAGEVPATSETERLCSSPKPPLPFVKNPLRATRELTFQRKMPIKHELSTCWRGAVHILPRYPRQVKPSVYVLPPNPLFLVLKTLCGASRN